MKLFSDDELPVFGSINLGAKKGRYGICGSLCIINTDLTENPALSERRIGKNNLHAIATIGLCYDVLHGNIIIASGAFGSEDLLIGRVSDEGKSLWATFESQRLAGTQAKETGGTRILPPAGKTNFDRAAFHPQGETVAQAEIEYTSGSRKLAVRGLYDKGAAGKSRYVKTGLPFLQFELTLIRS
ncbi:hypothetical protein SAMN05518849_1379 [Sphingobium sp. AP50]|nr:hypothetical protein SAMN05518849_1379 [Sphingobium sp. AP50]